MIGLQEQEGLVRSVLLQKRLVTDI